MKIRTIYIKNFGKLKDFRLDLKPGINIIYGKNEAGKTTVMNFIKMMFYGSNSKSSDINKNPRKKYTPWDNSEMGGFIEFEHSSTRYRLERTFGSSNVSDTVSLWNLSTGQSEPLNSKTEVGEQFFGIGASAFERSIFIGKMSSVIGSSDKEDEITKRLMNFATSCEESVSYEVVRQRLKKAHEELHSKNGKNGEIDKAVQILSDKTEALDSSRVTEQQKLADEMLCSSFCEHLRKKTDFLHTLEKQLKEQHIIRNLHALETQNKKNLVKESLEQKLELLRNRISNGRFTVSKEFLDKSKEMLEKLNRLDSMYTEKKIEFNALSEEISESGLSEKIQNNYVELDNLSDEKKQISKTKEEKEELLVVLHKDLEELQEKFIETQVKEEMYKEHLEDIENSSKSTYILILVFFIILFIALYTHKPLILTAIFPAGILLLLIEKLIKIIQDSREKKNPELVKKAPDYESAYKEIEKLKEDTIDKIADNEMAVHALNDQYNEKEMKKHEIEIENNKLITQNEQKMSEKNKLNANLISANTEITTLTIDLKAFFSQYKQTSNTVEIESHIQDAELILSEIEKTQAVLTSKAEEDIINDTPENVRTKIKILKEKLAELTGPAGPKLLTDEQIDALEKNLDETKKEIEKVNDEISSMRNKIHTQYNVQYSPSILDEEISSLKKDIRSMKIYDKSVNIAISALEEAGNEIRQTFGPELNTKTRKIFSHLTNGKYNEILVSKNLDIGASESTTEKIHEWQYLSSGTSEQAYFALRLAMADMITKNKLPLFLDDVFIQYDHDRAKNGFNFISEYSRITQVLFFTCHKYDIFEDKLIQFPEQ